MGIINKDGKMVIGPKADMEKAAMKLMKESKDSMKRGLKDSAAYKASGGNVAGYYNKGGKVAGCGSSRNKP